MFRYQLVWLAARNLDVYAMAWKELPAGWPHAGKGDIIEFLVQVF
jgi:hypothetical protein